MGHSNFFNIQKQGRHYLESPRIALLKLQLITPFNLMFHWLCRFLCLLALVSLKQFLKPFILIRFCNGQFSCNSMRTNPLLKLYKNLI